MKTKLVKSLIAIALLFTTINTFAQDDIDLFSGFDFRSQSGFASLSPGDTSKMNIVVYSGQEFRIFVTADYNLGDVKFRIFSRERKNEKIIKDIKHSENIIYKTDADGNFLYDDNYNQIIDRKETIRDTVWEFKSGFQEILIFDSENNSQGISYWQKTINKTARLIVEVIVPEGSEPDYIGEVEVYVGRRAERAKGFNRY